MSNWKLLRVWPEWGSSGIWVLDTPFQATAGGMADHDILNLPQELAARFDRWIEWLWDAMPDMPTAAAFDWTAFEAEGRQLAVELKKFLGPEVRVEYRAGKSTIVIEP